MLPGLPDNHFDDVVFTTVLFDFVCLFKKKKKNVSVKIFFTVLTDPVIVHQRHYFGEVFLFSPLPLPPYSMYCFLSICSTHPGVWSIKPLPPAQKHKSLQGRTMKTFNQSLLLLSLAAAVYCMPLSKMTKQEETYAKVYVPTLSSNASISEYCVALS